jgi:hypothetical protein
MTARGLAIWTVNFQRGSDQLQFLFVVEIAMSLPSCYRAKSDRLSIGDARTPSKLALAAPTQGNSAFRTDANEVELNRNLNPPPPSGLDAAGHFATAWIVCQNTTSPWRA